MQNHNELNTFYLTLSKLFFFTGHNMHEEDNTTGMVNCLLLLMAQIS